MTCSDNFLNKVKMMREESEYKKMSYDDFIKSRINHGTGSKEEIEKRLKNPIKGPGSRILIKKDREALAKMNKNNK